MITQNGKLFREVTAKLLGNREFTVSSIDWDMSLLFRVKATFADRSRRRRDFSKHIDRHPVDALTNSRIGDAVQEAIAYFRPRPPRYRASTRPWRTGGGRYRR